MTTTITTTVPPAVTSISISARCKGLDMWAGMDALRDLAADLGVDVERVEPGWVHPATDRHGLFTTVEARGRLEGLPVELVGFCAGGEA